MATTDNKTCAESVWHQDGNWGRTDPCARKAGFGPDGKYCRQHSERYSTEGPATTWYQADCFTDYSCAIKPVSVLKETDKFLLVTNGTTSSREKKSSDFYRYFKTKAEAVDFYRQRINRLRAQADALEARVNAAE